VLLELKEYSQEVDVDFVRRSVRAIGRTAIKLERAAERCINVLLELIQTKVNYVVQEAIIVIKDIFRRYPNRYESIIATLCENLETLDEPEAKASMIWIIGEYAERIENADELLESFFLETFEDETPQVQLQLLTATVKIFLKQPNETQEMVQRVLNLATEGSDNPDLRDRGFIYWRLLSHNPQVAKSVILSEKPHIADDTFALEPALLDQLIFQIATLASIYHEPPESFVIRSAIPLGQSQPQGDEEDYELDFLDGVPGETAAPSAGAPAKGASNANRAQPEVDLLDMGGLGLDDAPAPASGAPSSSGGLLDLLGGSPTASTAGSTSVASGPKPVVCRAEQGQGVEIRGILVQRAGVPVLDLEFTNMASFPLTALAVKFNVNTFGLTPKDPQIVFATPVPMNGTAPFVVPLTSIPQMVAQGQPPSLQLQVAIKNMGTQAVFYFAIPINMEALFASSGQIDKSNFINAWKAIDDSLEVSSVIQDVPNSSVDAVTQRFAANNILFIARRPSPGAPGQESAYFSAVTITQPPTHFLLELTFRQGISAVKVAVKTQAGPLAGLAGATIANLLKS